VAAAGRVLWSDRLSMPARITVTAGDRTVRASYLAVANQHPYSYWGWLPVRTTPRAGFASALDAVAVSALRPHQLWRLPAYGPLRILIPPAAEAFFPVPAREPAAAGT
jgi:hypothetical protein